MNNYKNLLIWQRSIDMVEKIYKLSSLLPKSEEYNLKSQLRRAAISIPSNIAEGCGRNSNKQLRHFLQIARGSLAELETQLIIIERLELLDIQKSVFDELLEISKMMWSFEKSKI